MTSLAQFRTAVSNELGLANDASTEQPSIDDAVNAGVQRVLEDTHCYVKSATSATFDGTSSDYTLDSGILEIVELYLTSTGTAYSLQRLSVQDIIERRRVGSPTGSPSQFYAVAGANLAMFYPAPAASDTLTVYYVPIPNALSASGDDPSTAALGGIPAVLHKAIQYFACSEMASYDDDQSSGQGQRYRDWYDKEIVRYKQIVRKRGGSRQARAVVNGKRRHSPFHTNDIYFSGR